MVHEGKEPMTAKWASGAVLAICLLLSLVGCRTFQPNLKPPPAPERYVDPPREARYEVPSYPKAAFDQPTDPAKRNNTPVNPAQGGRGGGMSAMSNSMGR